MATLHFHQIFPHQTLPILSKETSFSIPKRAQFFCHPFKMAANKGLYAYPPIDFSVCVTDKYIDIKAPLNNGGEFNKRVNKEVGAANFILLSNIDKTMSDTCLKQYRDKLKSNNKLKRPI